MNFNLLIGFIFGFIIYIVGSICIFLLINTFYPQYAPVIGIFAFVLYIIGVIAVSLWVDIKINKCRSDKLEEIH